jgi:hypothetical protein
MQKCSLFLCNRRLAGIFAVNHNMKYVFLILAIIPIDKFGFDRGAILKNLLLPIAYKSFGLHSLYDPGDPFQDVIAPGLWTYSVLLRHRNILRRAIPTAFRNIVFHFSMFME